MGYQRAPGTSEKKRTPGTSERFVANCGVGPSTRGQGDSASLVKPTQDQRHLHKAVVSLVGPASKVKADCCCAVLSERLVPAKKKQNAWYQRALRCQLRRRPFHPWAGRLRFSGEAHPGPATLTQSSSFSCGAGLQIESRLLLCCAPAVVHAC